MTQSQILHDRARSLAQAELTEQESVRLMAERIKVIEFHLAHETYAIESVLVREVYPLKELTPVPCTPPFIAGMVNIRGQILTVIDLKQFFDLPNRELTALSKVIVVRTDNWELGFLADEIIGMRFITPEEMQGSLPTLTGLRAEYLRGVTVDRTVLLNIDKLLADEKLIVREEVA